MYHFCTRSIDKFGGLRQHLKWGPLKTNNYKIKAIFNPKLFIEYETTQKYNLNTLT